MTLKFPVWGCPICILSGGKSFQYQHHFFINFQNTIGRTPPIFTKDPCRFKLEWSVYDKYHWSWKCLLFRVYSIILWSSLPIQACVKMMWTVWFCGGMAHRCCSYYVSLIPADSLFLLINPCPDKGLFAQSCVLGSRQKNKTVKINWSREIRTWNLKYMHIILLMTETSQTSCSRFSPLRD